MAEVYLAQNDTTRAARLAASPSPQRAAAVEDVDNREGGLEAMVQEMIGQLEDGETKKIRIGLPGYRYEALTLPRDNDYALKFAREIDAIWLAYLEQQEQEAEVEEPPKKKARWPLWAAGGLGVLGAAAVGAGVYFDGRVRSANEEAEAEQYFGPAKDILNDAEGDINRRNLFYGVGAGLLALSAGSLIYYFLQKPQAGDIAILPHLDGDTAGFAIYFRQ